MPPRRAFLVVLISLPCATGFLADVVVAIHALYVGFVVFGLVAILIGYALGWRWVRNRYFRILHLAAIRVGVRRIDRRNRLPADHAGKRFAFGAGQNGYGGDFIGYWLDRLIFYDFPPRVFTTIYFGLRRRRCFRLSGWCRFELTGRATASPTDR